MMKRLSIIIPTYNMEHYLANALDSIVVCERCADIDVVVVNDGSRDGSLSIALGYADSHPDTVRVIDKENGNYGSTINAALGSLRGEYVKILDADDRFDSAALDDFVGQLEAVSGTDVVVSPYIEEGRDGTHRCDYDLYGKQIFKTACRYSLDEVLAAGQLRPFAMHALTYRTALLRESGYRQSEGISYTDREWAFYPMFYAESIAFTSTPIYIYNTAREGQTMDLQVIVRSISHLQQVAQAMGKYFIEHSNMALSMSRRLFLRAAVEERMRVIYRLYLITMPSEMFVRDEFEQCDKQLSMLLADCGIPQIKVRQNALLPIDALQYWRRSHKRLPDWVRLLLIWLDRRMAWLHSHLFR